MPDTVNAVLHNGHLAGLEFLPGLKVVDFDIPSLPVKRFVIEDHKLVGLATLGQYFALRLDVVQTCDHTIVHLDAKIVVLENEDAWFRGAVNRFALLLVTTRGDFCDPTAFVDDNTVIHASRVRQRRW